MNLKKIKSILKSKRVQIIGGTVCGALALALVGTIILTNGNDENKVAIAENKDIVEEENHEVIEDENIDNNLTDEDKVEDNVNTELNEEENLTTQNDTIAKTLSNEFSNEASDSQNLTNNKTSNKTENKESISNGASTSVSSISNNSTSNISNNKPVVVPSSSNSNPNNGTSNTPKPDNHTHNWIPITNTVHHEEQGHNEKVLVSEAWTEEVPIYEEKEVMICNDCGVELNPSNCYDHVENHLLNGGKGSWREEWKKVQVGTNKINHEAVYENKWVVDKAAWDETVTTGHKCSGCGETK